MLKSKIDSYILWVCVCVKYVRNHFFFITVLPVLVINIQPGHLGQIAIVYALLWHPQSIVSQV